MHGLRAGQQTAIFQPLQGVHGVAGACGVVGIDMGREGKAPVKACGQVAVGQRVHSACQLQHGASLGAARVGGLRRHEMHRGGRRYGRRGRARCRGTGRHTMGGYSIAYRSGRHGSGRRLSG